MLRQLNVKRQLTIPAPLARRMGLSAKGWVDVSERRGALVVVPMNLEAHQAKSLDLTDEEWRAFNRKVRKELSAGAGQVYADARTFLADLKRRMTRQDGSTPRRHA
jgi:bifunctional DNA-binding transcriptional regulator/antitoxin component of YhaV-PrlF toxin-antitoxin module